jgi:hypothetical protein
MITKQDIINKQIVNAIREIGYTLQTIIPNTEDGKLAKNRIGERILDLVSSLGSNQL